MYNFPFFMKEEWKFLFCFFFQAEDGIRDGRVTGVQTCALPILPVVVAAAPAYLARRGEPKTPQELAAHDCIRLRLPSGGFFPWRFRLNRRIVEVHVEGPLIVNGSTIPLTAAIQGAG